jgi:hypothetical protein
MIDNCTYNKAKVLHHLAKINWFIEQHCKKDAKAAKHSGCDKLFKSIQKDLEKNVRLLQEALSK